MSSLVFNEKSHRYKLDNKAIKSVTTILKGGIPKDALIFWSAKVVAEYAAELLRDFNATRGLTGHRKFQIDDNELDGVNTGSSIITYPDEIILAELKEVPRYERDTAGSRGTNVHAIAEELLDLNEGAEFEIPAYYTDEEVDYATQVLEFIEKFKIKKLYTENLIYNRTHNYAGKFDAIVTSDLYSNEIIMLDFKTSNSFRADTALQLAAYRNAEYIVIDDADVPMSDIGITKTLGVWIQPDFYKVFELDTGEESFNKFLHASAVSRFATDSQMKKLIKKELTGENNEQRD